MSTEIIIQLLHKLAHDHAVDSEVYKRNAALLLRLGAPHGVTSEDFPQEKPSQLKLSEQAYKLSPEELKDLLDRHRELFESENPESLVSNFVNHKRIVHEFSRENYKPTSCGNKFLEIWFAEGITGADLVPTIKKIEPFECTHDKVRKELFKEYRSRVISERSTMASDFAALYAKIHIPNNTEYFVTLYNRLLLGYNDGTNAHNIAFLNMVKAKAGDNEDIVYAQFVMTMYVWLFKSPRARYHSDLANFKSYFPKKLRDDQHTRLDTHLKPYFDERAACDQIQC